MSAVIKYDKNKLGFIFSEEDYDRLSAETKLALFNDQNLRVIREGYTYTGSSSGVRHANMVEGNGDPMVEGKKKRIFRDIKENGLRFNNRNYGTLFGKKDDEDFPSYVFYLKDQEKVSDFVNYFTENGTKKRAEMVNFIRSKDKAGEDFITKENRGVFNETKNDLIKGRTEEVLTGLRGEPKVAEEPPMVEEEQKEAEVEDIEDIFTNPDLTTGTGASLTETIKGTAEEVIKDGLKSHEGIISAGAGSIVGGIATGAVEGILGTGSPIGAVVGAIAGGLASEKVKTTIDDISKKSDAGSTVSLGNIFDEPSEPSVADDVPSLVGGGSLVSAPVSSAVEDMVQTETIHQVPEELPQERVGKNLYKPIHEDAIYLFFGTNLEWDTNLLAHRANSPDWKDISKKKQFMLNQSRMIVKNHGDKILVPELVYGESSSVENILKENFEILELYMSYTNNRRFPRTFPNGSGSSDKVVSMRLNDLIEYRKQFEGEGFDGASMAPSVIEPMGETKQSSSMKVISGSQSKNGITTLQTEAEKPKFFDPTIANKISDETMRLTKPNAIPVRNQKHILGYTNIHNKDNLRELNKKIIKGSFGVPNYQRNLDGQIHLDGDYTATSVGGSIPMKKMAVKGDCKTTGVKL